MPTAGIVIIGDEILSGKFVEENAAFLIGELRGARASTCAGSRSIPDDLEDIAATVTDAAARYDHVFTSGGVGPTHDDITMAAIAHALRHHGDAPPRARGQGPRLLEGPARRREPAARRRPERRRARLRQGRRSGRSCATATSTSCPACRRCSAASSSTSATGSAPSPVTAARLYLDIEEGELAPHLDAMVAAHPGVRIGSYPRFSERDFRVLVTLEGAGRRRGRRRVRRCSRPARRARRAPRGAAPVG